MAGRASTTPCTSRRSRRSPKSRKSSIYDHRGQGAKRAARPDTLNLAQWGDDVKGLCDALGIEKPIVIGTSFGGFVAQSYATRHPDHPAKLILHSTAAKIVYEEVFAAFERVGGKAARDVAEALLARAHDGTAARLSRQMLPALQYARPARPDVLERAIVRHEVGLAFNGPNNEQGRMDFRAELKRREMPGAGAGGRPGSDRRRSP